MSKFSINVYTHHKNRIIYIYYQVNTVKELVRYNYDSFTYKERDWVILRSHKYSSMAVIWTQPSLTLKHTVSISD